MCVFPVSVHCYVNRKLDSTVVFQLLLLSLILPYIIILALVGDGVLEQTFLCSPK